MKKLISILTVFLVALVATQTSSAQYHNPKNSHYYIEKEANGVRLAFAETTPNPPQVLGYLFNFNDYSVVVEFEIWAIPCNAKGTPIGKKNLLRRSSQVLAPNSQWQFFKNDNVKFKEVELVKFKVTRK